MPKKDAAIQSTKPPKGFSTLLTIGKAGIFWPSLIMFGYLSVVSLIFNTVFPTDYREETHVLLGTWPLTLLLGSGFLALAAAAIAKGWYKRIPAQQLRHALYIFCGLCCVAWIFIARCDPVADQRQVYVAASVFAEGDYSLLTERADYFVLYPFQLGLVFFWEMLFRAAGPYNYYLIQLINVAANLIILWALLQIGRTLFDDEATDFMLTLLCFGCLPLYFYATFIYGTLPGLMFALLAVLQALRWNKTKKIRHLGFSIVFAALAGVLKNNYIIFAIAIGIYFILEFLRKPCLSLGVATAALAVASIFAIQPIYAYYSARSGVTISEGMPAAVWLSIGIQESWRGPGWYSEAEYEMYMNTGKDPAQATEISMQKVREGFAAFSKSPLRGLAFYNKKNITQWCEPTFASLWVSNNTPSAHELAPTALGASIYTGKLYRILQAFLDMFQFAVYAGCAAFLLIKRKSIQPAHLLLPLVVLGGFLFHTFWEAKSQYTMPYFIACLPMAAAGLTLIAKRLPALWAKLRAKAAPKKTTIH